MEGGARGPNGMETVVGVSDYKSIIEQDGYLKRTAGCEILHKYRYLTQAIDS